MKKQVICYGIGIDISKDWFHACISCQIQEGKVVVCSQKRFKNEKKGHEQFMAWMEKHRKVKNVNYQVLLEVTGVYHERLLYFLNKMGVYVCVEKPSRVKKYIEVLGYKSKTDKLDGKAIATMAIERKFAKWSPCSKNILELRSLLRHRKSLQTSRIQFYNQLHAMKISVIEMPEVIESLEKMIGVLNTQIKTIEKQTDKLAKKDQPLMKKVNMIIDSVKGLGWISVSTVIAETNGFTAFTSEKQLVSYAGYDVIENSSGKHKGKTRISKAGNTHIRSSMYMPAMAVIRCKVHPFYGLYERIVKRNGAIKKKALVAVQRKLLILIYTLWKKNEAFNEKYNWKTSKKNVVPIQIDTTLDRSHKVRLPLDHKDKKLQ